MDFLKPKNVALISEKLLSSNKSVVRRYGKIFHWLYLKIDLEFLVCELLIFLLTGLFKMEC